MSEITVETTGSFMLVDRFSGAEISAVGSTTVPVTPFITERLDNGDLTLVSGELPELKAPLVSDPLPLPEPLDPVIEGEPEPTVEEPLAPIVSDPLPLPEPLDPAPTTNDADADGHDDATGEFVEGNQEAAKPRKSRSKSTAK